MLHKNKVEYSLCEFFWYLNQVRQGKISMDHVKGTKRFGAGGAMVVDVGGLALIETASGGGGIELDRPLEFAHEGRLSKQWLPQSRNQFRHLKKVSHVAFQETGHRTCATRGTCNRDTGTCACREGWAPPYCQKSTCISTCNTEGGKCEWIDRLKRKHKRCFCKLGFGGDNCEKELCPNECGGQYRGKCTVIPHTDNSTLKYFKNAKCVCKQGLGGEDCMNATGCGGSGHDCGNNGNALQIPVCVMQGGEALAAIAKCA